MTDHDPNDSVDSTVSLFATRCRDEYRKQVGKLTAASKADNKHAMRDEAIAAVVKLAEQGQWTPDLAEAVRAQCRSSDKADKSSSDRVMRDIVHGQHGLVGQDDPALDLVVTLGGNRRKPLRFLTSEDVFDMDKERAKNLDRVVQHYHEQWRPVFERTQPALLKYGTFGAAVKANAFLTAEQHDAA